MKLYALAPLLLLVWHPPATAGELPPVAVLKGTCEQFVLGGTDLSDACPPYVMYTEHDGFYSIVIGEGVEPTLIAFMGQATTSFPRVQALTTVQFHTDELDGAQLEVRGTCAYGDPSSATTISCQAVDASGSPFLLLFKTNGDVVSAKAEDRISMEVDGWTIRENVSGHGCTATRYPEVDLEISLFVDVAHRFDIHVAGGAVALSSNDLSEDVSLFVDNVEHPIVGFERKGEDGIMLYGSTEEGHLMGPIENSRKLTIKDGVHLIDVPLFNVSEAIGATNECALASFEKASS